MRNNIIILALATTLSAPFGGCATVNLQGPATDVVEVSEASQMSSQLKRDAKALTAQYFDQGWSTYNPEGKMKSAIGFLKEGWGQKDTPAKPSDIYFSSATSRGAVLQDLNRMRIQLEAFNSDAQLFLDLSGEGARYGSEISAIEDVLRSARSAESHFTALFEDKFGDTRGQLDSALLPLSKAIKDLSDTADLMGDMSRKLISLPTGSS